LGLAESKRVIVQMARFFSSGRLLALRQIKRSASKWGVKPAVKRL